MSESRIIDETLNTFDNTIDCKTHLFDESEKQSSEDVCDSTCCSTANISCSDERRTNENTVWPNQMNWECLDGTLNPVDHIGELNKEAPSPVSPPKLFKIHNTSSDGDEYGGESTKTYKARSSFEDEEYEELKQFRRVSDNSRRETSTVEGINELIKKFSTIELLRRKENLQKSQEETNNASPTCSSNILRHASPKPWDSEEFLEDKTFKIPNPRHDLKDTDCVQEESDSDAEDGNIRDMELIKLLLSHALSKEKQQGKKRGDAILTATCINSKTKKEHYNDDVCETDDSATEAGVEYTANRGISSLSKTGGENSLNHNDIFDGFEIDCPDSFQNWMLDSILSKDIYSSSDMEEKSYFL